MATTVTGAIYFVKFKIWEHETYNDSYLSITWQARVSSSVTTPNKQTNKKETLRTDLWSSKRKFVCFLFNRFTTTTFAFLVLFPSKNGLKKKLSSLKMRLQRTLFKVRIRQELDLKPYSMI